MTDFSSIRPMKYNGIVSLPNVSYIGSRAFEGANYISGLELSDALTSIGARVFAGCSGIKGIIRMPAKIASIESVAFGVPTITTSLSGFGQWILSAFSNDFEDCGVNVIARGDYNYDSVSHSIAQALYNLASSDEMAAARISKAAMATASAAAWSNFIVYYNEAFNVAMDRAQKRNA